MAKDTRKLSIVVSIRDQTKKALGSITARMKQFAEKTSAAIRRAFKIGMAAAAVAVAGFVNEIRKQFGEIDYLAKQAFRFGVAIDEIRGLELAGKLAGVSLSELGTILRATARRVNLAAQGTGEAKTALESLGLSAEELTSKPLTEQISTLLDEIKKLPTEAEQVTAAFAIMGEAGPRALTMTSGSIRSAIRETELFGTALDEEVAGNVQKANDAMTRMKEAFKGIVQFAVSEAAPQITQLLKRVKQFLIEIRNGIQAVPLTVEAELIKVRTLFAGLEKDLLSTKVGKFLLGEQPAADLGTLIRADEKRLKEIQKQLQDMTRQGGDLSGGTPEGGFAPPGTGGGESDTGASEQRASRGPLSPPGIVSGRLLTGAAQSSAERLANIAKQADEQRRKEAMKAEKDRKVMNDLLRTLVQNQSQTQLGTLLN